MDFKQIQELIKTVNKSNIGELHIEDNDFKITIKQKPDAVQQVAVIPSADFGQPQFQSTAAQQTLASLPTPTPDGSASAPTQKANNLITIKSPMIGTFYRKSTPDKPSLVEVGDEIAPGKVVCIIEAMKLFNEIESEVSGKIVKVLVENASPVEYDQPLFMVEPV
ncbi:MAG: acetyl-CoA carboxylase biotin carboxyl carrier protein [Bacteroidota bacterium]|nr:acetyl-CoA carboxylase biotin carboxyl carrier protein [Bacteroidota bacterium]